MHFGLLPHHLDDLTPRELGVFVERLKAMRHEELQRLHRERHG